MKREFIYWGTPASVLWHKIVTCISLGLEDTAKQLTIELVRMVRRFYPEYEQHLYFPE